MRVSLCPIQPVKRLDHPQFLPTQPINNTTNLLPTLIGKESASLEYLIDIIFKIELQQIYPALYRPKNSEMTAQP